MTDERDAMREALMSGQSVRDALTEYVAPLPEAPESVAWCGASMRADFARAVPYMGPCVLRAGHDGPVHQDADGVQWTDPRPAMVEDAAALCPPDPHPYVHLTYGSWEPSGHQCGDIQQGGCDDVIPERRVIAHGVASGRFVGYELRDCPSCGLPGEPALDEQSAHDAECERVWTEYPKVIDALREQTQRAERVEALLRDLVDPDDCYFDHHGGCQAHGYLSLQPGEKCPHTEAKEILAALDQPEAPDHD